MKLITANLFLFFWGYLMYLSTPHFAEEYYSNSIIGIANISITGLNKLLIFNTVLVVLSVIAFINFKIYTNDKIDIIKYIFNLLVAIVILKLTSLAPTLTFIVLLMGVSYLISCNKEK